MMWMTWNNYVRQQLGMILLNQEVELSLQQEMSINYLGLRWIGFDL